MTGTHTALRPRLSPAVRRAARDRVLAPPGPDTKALTCTAKGILLRSSMDPLWQKEFRKRMADFGSAKPEGSQPISIKIRVDSGCFHREHSPEAYKLIDAALSGAGWPGGAFKFEEHESGPEILVFAAVATAGLTLAKSVIELITAIVKARAEGIKKGDHPSAPLEIIVRGYWQDGEYFEKKILRVPPGEIVTAKLIEDAIAACPPKPEKAARTRRRKH